MKISNILKIADFETDHLSTEFANWVCHCTPTYRDELPRLKEHIYNTEDLEEFLSDIPQVPESVSVALAEIKTLLKEADCSYFRIIKN